MTKEDKNLLQEAPKEKEEKTNFPFANDSIFGDSAGNEEQRGGLVKQIKLKKRSGPEQYNIVNFWATWCKPCKKEMPHFAAVIKSNPDLHFFFVTTHLGGDQSIEAAKEQAEKLWKLDGIKGLEGQQRKGVTSLFTQYEGQMSKLKPTTALYRGTKRLKTKVEMFASEEEFETWLGEAIQIKKAAAEVKPEAEKKDFKTQLAKLERMVQNPKTGWVAYNNAVGKFLQSKETAEKIDNLVKTDVNVKDKKQGYAFLIKRINKGFSAVYAMNYWAKSKVKVYSLVDVADLKVVGKCPAGYTAAGSTTDGKTMCKGPKAGSIVDLDLTGQKMLPTVKNVGNRKAIQTEGKEKNTYLYWTQQEQFKTWTGKRKVTLEGAYPAIVSLVKTGKIDPKIKPKEKPEEVSPAPKPTPASIKYNIRKPAPRSPVSGFQGKLKTFYQKNAATKAVADRYLKKAPAKLTDGRYGYRTHAVSRTAIDDLIRQVKEAQAKQKTVTKESRIEKLSKLLNEKLANTQSNWLFEAPLPPEALPDVPAATPPPAAAAPAPAAAPAAKVDYGPLLAKLTRLKTAFDGAYKGTGRPAAKALIDSNDVKELGDLLGELAFKGGNITNLAVLAKKESGKPKPDRPEAGPVGPVGKEKEEKPKPVPQKRHRETSCRFAMNLASRGQQLATPDSVFLGTKYTWEQTYKLLQDLFRSQITTFAYDYSTNPERKRQSTIFSNIDNTKTETWNLMCLKTYFENMLVILKGDKAMYDHKLGVLKEGPEEVKAFRKETGPQERSLPTTIAALEAAIGQINVTVQRIAIAARKLQAAGRNEEATAVANIAGKEVAKKVAASPPVPVASAQGPEAKEKRKRRPPKPVVKKVTTKGVGVMSRTAGGKIPPESDPAKQQESLKQRRDELLNEYLFKKLV